MKNLRVIRDGDLSFSNHITNITKLPFSNLELRFLKSEAFLV